MNRASTKARLWQALIRRARRSRAPRPDFDRALGEALSEGAHWTFRAAALEQVLREGPARNLEPKPHE